MPLFSRPDGDPVRDLSPVRRIIPYLMRGRNESVVYYEQILDLSRTLPFVESWNREHGEKLTVFHLVLAGLARTLHARPGLNRFVSGGRIYQRRGVQLSFAAKKRFSDEGQLATVKLEVPAGEALADTVHRIHGAVGEGRSDRERAVDREVRWVLYLPGFVVAFLVGLMRLLDRWNLLPGALTRNDPMYASLFAANLGSVGIDRAWHHLYEYGTISVFAALGQVRKDLVVLPDGRTEVRDVVRIRYAFDERINDGFYCASSLGMVREHVENPELFAAPAPAGPQEHGSDRPKLRASAT